MSASLDQARAAKALVADRFSTLDEVDGIGIARLADGFGVKVNLRRASPATAEVPDEIDGVPVIVEEIGEITPF